MRRRGAWAAMAAGMALLAAGCGRGGGATGAALFATHCAGCHPDGGNTVNPKKTLRPADRQANGIRTADDVAAFIRNPGQGMPAFPPGVIPPGDARRIGAYVIAAFR
ncbi:c-type cytochrome [Geobacter pickeringii]|uniref:Cytochrome C n=1 Tax=Geobacter pickeringii TaxID=345632 RepID=A0A0B5BIM3_9BACT|nr:c-type cytochrome [Geobacter pickeringii]AJE03886.1 cytochrome C [Geobacter pickeringii]